jgi:hypothetical protein
MPQTSNQLGHAIALRPLDTAKVVVPEEPDSQENERNKRVINVGIVEGHGEHLNEEHFPFAHPPKA